MLDLTNLKQIKLDNINPLIKKELLEFCSSLDKEDFPEAVLISSGKRKTLVGLVAIYEKLKKSKKEKNAQKRLKKAEKMILSISRLHNRHDAGRGAVENARPLPRLEIETERQRTHQIAIGTVDNLRRIEAKIATDKALTIDEALEFAAVKYAESEEKMKIRAASKKKSKSIRVVMCSDSRNTLGEIEFENSSTTIITQTRNYETKNNRSNRK